jgi:hypothetical protein
LSRGGFLEKVSFRGRKILSDLMLGNPARKLARGLIVRFINHGDKCKDTLRHFLWESVNELNFFATGHRVLPPKESMQAVGVVS